MKTLLIVVALLAIVFVPLTSGESCPHCVRAAMVFMQLLRWLSSSQQR